MIPRQVLQELKTQRQSDSWRTPLLNLSGSQAKSPYSQPDFIGNFLHMFTRPASIPSL